MLSGLSPADWAKRSAAHPWRVIAIWGVVFAVSVVVIGALLSGVLSSDQTFVNTPESMRAQNAIEQQIGVKDAVVEDVIVTTSSGLQDSATRDVVAGLVGKLRGLGPAVVSTVTSPLTGDGSLISKDGRTAVIPVVMAGDFNDAQDDIEKVLDTALPLNGTNGLAVNVTGQASVAHDSNTVAEQDLVTGEMIGIPIALLILMVVFGALVAALLPILLAVIAIVVALALTALVGQFGHLSFFVTNMITMMGLAVGIDYSLFVASRYREERGAGVSKIQAIERAGQTASRAVFFSGMTVVVALIGLLIVPTSIFVSLAVGAILVVISAIAAAQTLLPAVLSVLGDRIDAGRLSRLIPGRWRRRERATGFWSRVVGTVMRRPLASLGLCVAILVAAAVPYFGITTGAAGVSSLPTDLQSRVGFEILQQKFSVGLLTPARIPIVGDPASAANTAQIDGITAAIAGDPVLGKPALVPGPAGRGAVLEVPVNADSTSQAAEGAVKRIRAATDLPVGGVTAQNVDFFDIADRYLPIVVALVLTMSFLVLLVAFRSLVVPFVAIAMNLLSVGAAFGLLTLVSQDGVGADIFGFQQVDTVEAWLPIFLFAVLFGLSMDYHVFLLSRIKERFLRTHDNVDSITHGITSSARLITGAALIMVAVFAGFAAGKLVMFQQMGFGLGVAVLIDATLVRGVLVPATMRLIGNHNWYLPKWLEWLPRFSVEGERVAGSMWPARGPTRPQGPAGR
jgi:RND superfamily putative drug exporter